MDSLAHKIVKKTDFQTLLDDFFQDMRLVDIVAASEIPLISIDGNEQRPNADIYFSKYSNAAPLRINSFTKEIDAIFWLFDTFCVLEINASNDISKQFVVLQQTSKEIYNSLPMLVDMELSFKMLPIKEAILGIKESFELILFNKAIDFSVKHEQNAIEILKKKYC